MGDRAESAESDGEHASARDAWSRMPTEVRLHQLEGFHHVATHGGFARAVEALPYPITEAALHQQVRKLERALGVSLLVRGKGRRMVCTPEGRSLLAFVSPYFERLPSTLRTLADGEGGTLVVGVEPLYVPDLAAPAVAELRRASGSLQVRIEEGDVRTIVEGLTTGRIDVGIAGEIEVAPADIRFEAHGRLGLSLLVPTDHGWVRKRSFRDLAPLADEPLVLYVEGSDARRHADTILGELGLRVRIAAEASSASAMRALVAAGVAPAVVPERIPEAGRARPRRRVLDNGVVDFDLTAAVDAAVEGRGLELPRYGVYVRRELHDHPRVREFIAQLPRK